jgi:hypothetical protein
MVVKNALKMQYPKLDSNKVYWPQSDESMMTGIQTAPNAQHSSPKPNLLVGIPREISKGNSLLPVFKHESFPMPTFDSLSTSSMPISHNHFNIPTNNAQQIPANLYRNNFETNKNLKQDWDRMNDYYGNNDYNNEYSDQIEERSDSESNKKVKSKRSSTADSFKNRVGNVPPERRNKNSTKVSTNKQQSIDRKAIKEKMMKLLHAFSDKNKQKNSSSTIDPIMKSSSNRMTSYTKKSESELQQPIKFMDLNQYKRMLTHSIDKKDDDDDDDDEDSFTTESDDSYEQKMHTTVQIISKPTQLHNLNLGSYLKSWFKFPRFFRRDSSDSSDRRSDENNSLELVNSSSNETTTAISINSTDVSANNNQV